MRNDEKAWKKDYVVMGHGHEKLLLGLPSLASQIPTHSILLNHSLNSLLTQLPTT